jgi:uncharacterized lipoprotein YmbA
MKRTILALALTAGLGLTGCASVPPQVLNYTLNVTNAVTAVIQARPEITQAEMVIYQNKKLFTPTQWNELLYLQSNINNTLNTALSMASGAQNPATIVINLTQLQSLYNSARLSYIDAKAIIAPKMSSFTPQEQMALQQLNSNMTALNSGIQALAHVVPGVNVNQVFATALAVASSAARLALAVGGTPAP